MIGAYADESKRRGGVEGIEESFRKVRERTRVFRFPYPNLDGYWPIVYRVLVEEWPGAWRKVRCWTRADERAFPKRAAEVGTRLVAEVKAQERGKEVTEL